MDAHISEFDSEQAAYDWSRENKACVGDDTGSCVFCARWDH